MVDSPYRHIPYDQRMSPHYRGPTVQKLGIGHMFISVLVIAFQGALFAVGSPARDAGAGFWSGAIYLVNGIVAIYSSTDPRRRGPAIAFLILSLISMIAAVAALVIALSGALSYKPQKGKPDDDWTAQLIFLATLTVLGITEFLLCIVSIQVVCKGLCHCCVAVQQAIESETTSQPAVMTISEKRMSPIPD